MQEIQKKQPKQDKYDKLLQDMNLNIIKKKRKLNDEKEQIIYNKEKGDFDIQDLLQAGQNNNENANINMQLSLLNKQNVYKQTHSFKKQEQIERQIDYQEAKQDAQKWIPKIKQNREALHLNFVEKSQPLSQVTHNSSEYLKTNKIGQKLESELNILGLANEKQIKEREVPTQKFQKSLNERNLLFYQELRNKRIKKIKSKLYRKIKNKKQQKEVNETLNDQLQNLERQRVEERMMQKHKTKSKYLQQIKRYGNKETYQPAINNVNQIRQNLLQKIQVNTNNIESEDYEDDNYIQTAILDLKKELDDNELEKTGLKFIDEANEEKRTKIRHETQKLLDKLLNNESNLSEEVEEEGFQGRQKFEKSIKNNKILYEEKEKEKVEQNMDVNKIMNQYLNEPSPKKILTQKQDNDMELTNGINIQKLKLKYNKNIDKELKQFEEENQQDFYQDLNDFKVIVDNENEKNFNKDKHEEYENQLPEEKNKLIGWGNWVGAGIKVRKVDPQQEKLKKIKQLQDLRKQRIDGQNYKLIKTEKLDTKFIKQYQVQHLPAEVQKSQQFDFINSQALGPEYNSVQSFNKKVQPRINARAGQIIKPIQLNSSYK